MWLSCRSGFASIDQSIGNDNQLRPPSLHSGGAAVRPALGRQPFLVVVAHAGDSISRSNQPESIPLPRGFNVWMYTKPKGMMQNKDVKEICDEMMRTGEVVAQHQDAVLQSSSSVVPNHTIDFRDVNGLERSVCRPLGVYCVNVQSPAGQRMLQMQAPHLKNGYTSVKDLVEWAAKKEQITDAVILSCRAGPSISVLGFHDPEGWCREARAELEVGVEYANLLTTDFRCVNCMTDVHAAAICLSGCQFQAKACVRPRQHDCVPMPLGVPDGMWLEAGDNTTIDLRGAVFVSLKTNHM